LRELGVTYKTAWRMFHKIRSLLTQDDNPFSGPVEMDEAYIGPKAKLARLLKKALSVRSAAQKRSKKGRNTTKRAFSAPEQEAEKGAKAFFNTLAS
jgi:hypothetical protein